MLHPHLSKILLEFPHLAAPHGRGSHHGYDAEWEKHQAPGSYPNLHAQMASVFAGNRHDDKHGGHIHLGRDRKAKLEYLETIHQDPTAMNMLANHIVPGFKALTTSTKETARQAAFKHFAGQMSPIINATSDEPEPVRK